MENLKSLLISLATLAIVMEFALATDGGWDALTALQAWASSKSFIVGEKLVFSYGPTHDVLQVSKKDYESCNPNNAITVYAGGLSTIQLTTPGKKYFICGTTGHCALGMKVAIDVLTSTAPTPSWTHEPWSPPGPTYAQWSLSMCLLMLHSLPLRL
ncbi:hypothetical protein Leryth_027090 [Lithospermum erythrorhizon]|nr:hypothetical protein Leryth_027090 [Lithospermum erythrorhizon]